MVSARELGVVDPAAADDLILQHPGQRGLGVLLHVPRHHGVAAPADRDVERRPRPPGIGQAGGKADLLDEALRRARRLDLPRSFAAPMLVAVLFDLGRNLWLLSHAWGSIGILAGSWPEV